MNQIIVSNNSLTIKNFSNSVYVEGDYIDVLLKVRDYVHIGYNLISSPLPASIRMIYSPVKSVILEKNNDIDENSIEVIENSIAKYKSTMGERKSDIRNKDDYEIIDLDLLKSAFEEIDFIDKIIIS